VGVPYRQIRASHDVSTVTVYQAYPPELAVPAAAGNGFPSWYNRDRMTWIKPSFLWMMYRSGWATKPGQECVLAIRLRRDGFEWALAHSALSHYDAAAHTDREAWQRALQAPVRIQWDPERDLHLAQLPYRSLQVGLSGAAVDRYVDEWIVAITDVTELAHRIHHLVSTQDLDQARRLLPTETPYPLSAELSGVIHATPLPLSAP
jgi:hypothetical protein